MKQNVEVEGGELLLMSNEQHYAIIPAKHRREVEDMVNSGCDACINDYIKGLPKNEDYAEDGSLIVPDNDPTKNNSNGVKYPKSTDDLYKYIDSHKDASPDWLKAQVNNYIYNSNQDKPFYIDDKTNPDYIRQQNMIKWVNAFTEVRDIRDNYLKPSYFNSLSKDKQGEILKRYDEVRKLSSWSNGLYDPNAIYRGGEYKPNLIYDPSRINNNTQFIASDKDKNDLYNYIDDVSSKHKHFKENNINYENRTNAAVNIERNKVLYQDELSDFNRYKIAKTAQIHGVGTNYSDLSQDEQLKIYNLFKQERADLKDAKYDKNTVLPEDADGVNTKFIDANTGEIISNAVNFTDKVKRKKNNSSEIKHELQHSYDRRSIEKDLQDNFLQNRYTKLKNEINNKEYNNSYEKDRDKRQLYLYEPEEISTRAKLVRDNILKSKKFNRNVDKVNYLITKEDINLYLKGANTDIYNEMVDLTDDEKLKLINYGTTKQSKKKYNNLITPDNDPTKDKKSKPKDEMVIGVGVIDNKEHRIPSKLQEQIKNLRGGINNKEAKKLIYDYEQSNIK